WIGLWPVHAPEARFPRALAFKDHSIHHQHRVIGVTPKRGRFHPSAPTQLGSGLAVLVQLARRHFVPLEDQLYFDVKFSPRKESRKCCQCAPGAAPRKEIAVLGKRKRTEPQADTRLMIPDLITGHCSPAQLFRVTRFLTDVSLVLLVHRI